MKSSDILFVNHSAVLGGGELSLIDIVTAFRERAKVLLLNDGPLVSRLRELGIAVDVLSLGPRISAIERRSGLLRLLGSYADIRSVRRQLGRRIEDSGIVYANSQKAFALASQPARRLGKPLLWHLRDLLTDDHFGRLQLRAVVRMASRGASRVIANSEATASAFVGAGGPASLVRVIYNGFPIPERGAIAGQTALRQELGIGDSPLVGSFSRLAPWKGQHILLQAAPRIDTMHVLIVGAPLFGDEELYLTELKNISADLGIAHRVHFLGSRTDVPSLMRQCDVVVHTSEKPEPFGRVVVEGMLAERPVVATDAGGVPEIVEHARTGLLVAPGSASALEEAIRTLLADPVEASRIARAGYQHAVRTFSIDRMVTELGEEFDVLSGE